MAEGDFIMAVAPNGEKRLVPAHYIDNPAFGFRLPPSEVAKAKAPASATAPERVEEPAATATSKKVTEPAAAGEKKEASE